MWGKPDEAEIQRMNWVKTLKEGDVVCYRIAKGRFSPPTYEVRKVKKTTPTGMVRLDDGTLWSSEGRLKGNLNVVLQPYTKEIKDHIDRVKLQDRANTALYHLGRDRRLLDKFSDEDLEQLIRIKNSYVSE